MESLKLGRWAFIFGILLAILLGFVSFGYSSVVLVILGLIVGLFNITEREAHGYLVAVIALLLIGLAGLQLYDSLSTISTKIEPILSSFITFVAASGLVVAIKEVIIFEKK